MPALSAPEFFAEIARSGFPHPQQLIHLFVGGSQLHGAKLEESDDLDIYGVYIESPEKALGLTPAEHYVWSTAGDDRRNGPDDVDVTLYSLRKWARMAARGNPTALHFLFAPDALRHPSWQAVVAEREAFLSRGAASRFIGFAENQFKRMMGEKGRGAKGQRPELEDKFGYDTKAAMHALRLLHECMELMQSGTLTFPRPERKFLIEVRLGRLTPDEFRSTWNETKELAEQSAAHSQLPESVDLDRVSRVLARVYQDHWRNEKPKVSEAGK